MASANLTSVAASDEFRKQEIDDVTDWSEVITASTKITAFMGKLSIARNRVPSFQIDQINKNKIPLIQDSRSFRSTLFQISGDSYEAFAKAHVNMFRIRLKTGKVLRYVADCMEYLKNDNRKAKKNSIRRRLDRIKQAADNGATISKEVCDAFDLLGQLIGQVIQALMKSLDVKKKENKKQQRENKHDKNDKSQKKLEAAEENVKEKTKDLKDTRKSKLGIRLSYFRHDELTEESESARKSVEDKSNKNIASGKHVRVVVDKVLNRNEMLQILNEGLNYLGQYHNKWSDIHRYFNKMSNDFTKALLTDFSAENVEENAIEELNKSLQMTSDFCAKMHHSAIMHAKVFHKYIMKNMLEIGQPMLCIPHDEIEPAQITLEAFWEEASKDIEDMYNKDRAEAI